MLRHAQSTARQFAKQTQQHLQQHQHQQPTQATTVAAIKRTNLSTFVAPFVSSSHSLQSHPSSSSSQSLPSSSATRLFHTVRSRSNANDDFFDPAAEKAKMKERMRLKREAEEAKRQAEEAANPKPAEGEANADGKATDPSSAASTDANASPSSAASPSQADVNRLWKWVKNEIMYAKQHIDSKKVATKKAKKRPVIQPSTIAARDWSEDPAEKAAAKLKADKEKEDAESEEPEYTGPTSLQVVNTETVWDQRLSTLKETIRRFGVAAPKKAVRGVVAKSESLSKLQEDLTDKVEEAKERWETSQDPRVWKMRDMVDKVVGESDTGVAIGEIMQSDPNWNYLEFLKEMEEVMIPEVIQAFRVGDMKLLKSVTEGDASRAMLASFRSREEQKIRWDERILDVRGVDIVKASLHEDMPFIHLTFVCQHVAVEYDAKTGEMKDPSLQSVVQNTYYSWAIKRDYESPYYDWKIFEFHYQNIQALI